MNFADYYLRKHNVSPKIITAPKSDLHFIIVIPCYDEPLLVKTLNSLKNCNPVSYSTEVIVVINSSQDTSEIIRERNLKTYSNIAAWFKENALENFQFHVLHEPDLPLKYAGAGLARKIGMDEAVSRFNMLNNKNGVIISMDADSTCDENFLTEIEKQYKMFPATNGTSIYFEHPLEGNEFLDEIYSGITRYELYLRFYLNALRYTLFPNAYYTIGSCFTVRVDAYVKQGGMNKRQAGEDFYFLQKIISLGNYYDLLSTRVIPSSRPSDRVPFGTGPMIQQYINGFEITTYDLRAFDDLKFFFQMLDRFFKIDEKSYLNILAELPDSIGDFLQESNFYEEIKEVNENSSNLLNFRKRFYTKFNAFRILKYLNYAHTKFYKKGPVFDATLMLADKIFDDVPKIVNEKEMLLLFRMHDRKS